MRGLRPRPMSVPAAITPGRSWPRLHEVTVCGLSPKATARILWRVPVRAALRNGCTCRACSCGLTTLLVPSKISTVCRTSEPLSFRPPHIEEPDGRSIGARGRPPATPPRFMCGFACTCKRAPPGRRTCLREGACLHPKTCRSMRHALAVQAAAV